MAQVTPIRPGSPGSILALVRRSPRIQLVLLAAALAAFAGLAIIAYANLTAFWASRGRMFSDIDKLPKTEVGLVFGTTHRVDGRENLYFRYRIDAAAEIFRAGKVRTLIVSGDNRTDYYNEPQRMREALIARGVPPDRIVRDFGGRRTLDSVVRAKEVWGVTEILLISQRFQNERAIYIAKAHGINAFAYNTRDVESAAGLKTKFREIGARVKMWLDVNILHTSPQVPSDPLPLPE